MVNALLPVGCINFGKCCFCKFKNFVECEVHICPSNISFSSSLNTFWKSKWYFMYAEVVWGFFWYYLMPWAPDGKGASASTQCHTFSLYSPPYTSIHIDQGEFWWRLSSLDGQGGQDELFCHIVQWPPTHCLYNTFEAQQVLRQKWGCHRAKIWEKLSQRKNDCNNEKIKVLTYFVW